MVPNGDERRRASTVFFKQTIMPRCNMARPNWCHISVWSRRRCCSAAGNPDLSAACSTFHSCAVNLHPPKLFLLSYTASQCETQRRRSPSQSLTAANSCMYRDAKDTAARCETQRRRSPTEAAVTSTIAQAAMCIHETRKTLRDTETAVTLTIAQGCKFMHTQTRRTQRATAGHTDGDHHHNHPSCSVVGRGRAPELLCSKPGVSVLIPRRATTCEIEETMAEPALLHLVTPKVRAQLHAHRDVGMLAISRHRADVCSFRRWQHGDRARVVPQLAGARRPNCSVASRA